MFPCSSIPRPEHPRPDRQRGHVEGVDWLNLNGHWQFRFDRQRCGIDERWFDPTGPDWREQIVVPFCWESLAARGEADSSGNENYFSTRVFVNSLEVTVANHRLARRHEVGWYRRAAEESAHTRELRFRCAVPRDAEFQGGLTVYGYDTGRFPIGPTIVIEWEQG